MLEFVLHYIWQQRLWENFPQTTTDGQAIEVLYVGAHNRDAGPDFSHARIRIGQQEWVGNIEMHIRASDWRRHHHHNDPAYNNVILHVVCQADEQAYNARGEAVATCELRFDNDRDYLASLIEHAMQMDNAYHTIHCHQLLLKQPALITHGWRNTLLRQRMDCRAASVKKLIPIVKYDWNEAFYISLAHNFGFHTNSLPFETMALRTPRIFLLKHANSLFQVTAMLLGQSGLLTEETATTDEEKALLAEYRFLRHKFSLQPIDGSLWKKARLRPQNAPQVRIRQFAQLICSTDGLLSKVYEADSVEAMRALLDYPPKTLAMGPLQAPPRLGQASIDVLIINTFLPYRYSYASEMQNARKKEESLRIMQAIPAEDNRIIRQWRMLGQTIHSAADTQALIHLYQNFCQNEGCIHCEVATQAFRLQP